MRYLTLLTVLFALSALSNVAKAVEESADAELLFAVDVLPVLKTKCFACHGDKPDDLKGDFDIRSREGMLKGGESGDPSLVPGKPEKSPFYSAIRWDDLEMPPKENDRLNAEQIDSIRKWIAAGAPWPNAERLAELQEQAWNSGHGIRVATSGGTTDDWTNRRYDPADLWAYQPIKDPSVPVKFAGSSKNAIDAFLNRKIVGAKLDVASPTDPTTFIRRATFDLTGLPPTPEEVDTFRKASIQNPKSAILNLITRLLASPRYGEQWGRHWLDVARYADSAGFSNDYARPNAWRYRDYVIRSFNEDKPYDQFIVEQLAGDEMRSDDPERFLAVGFLRMGPWEHTAMSVAAVTRQQFLDDVVNNVGVTFLGQELRCCKCHDHKFDPLPTRDYYRFQAVFAPVQFADRDLAYLASENTNGMQAAKKRIEKLQAAGGVKSLKTIPKEQWPVAEYDADSENKGHGKVNSKRKAYLSREMKRFRPLAFSVYSGSPRNVSSGKLVMPVGNSGGKAQEIHILAGGSLESPGERVGPGVLSVSYATTTGRNEIKPAITGRRLELARWIASPDNPMTARVMVNRIWQYHFGRGLAGNPNNFGKTGKKPTHPELLDYLASWFIKEGWSIKKLHKLIMTSNAYARASRPASDKVAQIDPENELLSWFMPRRLTAEELRDAMLQVTGELNLEMGGIPARPEINMEVAMQPRHIMGSVSPAYQPDRTPEQRHRRTIYAERIRTLRDPMLEVFNQPGLDASCERRDTASTTPQVFTLFNGQTAHDRALALVNRVTRETNSLDERISLAIKLAFGREATPEEIKLCNAHVAKMTAHHEQNKPKKVEPPKFVIREMVEEQTGLNFYWVEDLDVYHDFVPDVKPWDVSAETRALADVCLVLFNSNEFIYVY